MCAYSNLFVYSKHELFWSSILVEKLGNYSGFVTISLGRKVQSDARDICCVAACFPLITCLHDKKR